MKKYGIPLIVIIVSSLLMYAVRKYINLEICTSELVQAVLSAGSLFVLGVYLNGNKGRKDTWIKKFIVMAVFILLFLNETGWYIVPFLNDFMYMIGAKKVIYYMLYVYLGYIFF